VQQNLIFLSEQLISNYLHIDHKMKSRNWETLAKEFIAKFYSRGGGDRGNQDRIIDATADLTNVVGFALNCFQNADLPDPRFWSKTEEYFADNGLKDFLFVDKEDCVVLDAIKESCGGDGRNYINVLPIVYQYGYSFFFSPLFRLRRSVELKPHFVDSEGKIYEDFNDWERNNRLPTPAVLFYPTNGVLDGLSVTKKVNEKLEDNSDALSTASSPFDTYEDPCEELGEKPLEEALGEKPISKPIEIPIITITDTCITMPHLESISQSKSKTSTDHRQLDTLKVYEPYGRTLQNFGSSEALNGLKAMKNGRISWDSLGSLKSFIENGDEDNDATKPLFEGKSLLEIPLTIQVNFIFCFRIPQNHEPLLNSIFRR
jgi:hypothetical protein